MVSCRLQLFHSSTWYDWSELGSSTKERAIRGLVLNNIIRPLSRTKQQESLSPSHLLHFFLECSLCCFFLHVKIVYDLTSLPLPLNILTPLLPIVKKVLLTNSIIRRAPATPPPPPPPPEDRSCLMVGSVNICMGFSIRDPRFNAASPPSGKSKPDKNVFTYINNINYMHTQVIC